MRSFRYFQLSTVSPQKTEMETNGNWAFDWLDLSKDSTKSNYDQITYKLGSVATWIHRLCDMTKKVTSGKRASRAASATSFLCLDNSSAPPFLWSKSTTSFFSEPRCRSSVNRQWSHFCRQIWATVYYHWTWTSLPFEFSQKKIAWLDLGENETFLSSANSRSKVESLIQRQIKMILQLFEKKRDTQCWKITQKVSF